MVDLMMWLVIAALLLAAAIQGIGYYQKAAYLYHMKSDLSGAGEVTMAKVADNDGKLTKTAVDLGTAESKWSKDVSYEVRTSANAGAKPYIVATHPGVPDRDAIYIFEDCGNKYAIGVNVIPKNGDVDLAACGISASDPVGGGGTGIPTDPPSTGLSGTGMLASWGYGENGELGNGPMSSSLTTGALYNKTVSSISAGSGSSCVVADGKAFCWGDNTYGQLGTGDTTYHSEPTAVVEGAMAGKTVTAIESRSSQTCAIADGAAYCWGGMNLSEGYPALGNGTNAGSAIPVAVTGLAGKTITKISPSNAVGVVDVTTNTCVVANDGKAYCWGRNSDGALGNGNTTSSYSPVAVIGALVGKTVTDVSGSTSDNSTYCAVASDGKAYCWGYGGHGQLGRGSYASASSSVAVSVTGVLAGKTVTSVSVSNTATCAVASDGKAYCWGWGPGGELGNGSDGQTTVPVAVDVSGALAGKTVTKIAAGGSHVCAIANDGNPYCWGASMDYSGYGPVLGNNTYDFNAYSPVAVYTEGGLKNKTTTVISSGPKLSCGVASGAAYCWGASPAAVYTSTVNWDYDSASAATPGKVGGATSFSTMEVSKFKAGENHACAISSNKAYCWGDNGAGQIGDGSDHVDAPFPVLVDANGVLAGKALTDIAGGSAHTCAVADGKAYCWGDNSSGQLGDGTTSEAMSPVAVDASGVLAGKTIVSVASGSDHSCAVDNGNKIYCWGANWSRQLGDSTGADSQVPVAVDMSAITAGAAITKIVSASEHTCVIAGGNPYCWGTNWTGQIGDGSTSDAAKPVAVDISGITGANGKTTDIDVSDSTCAVINSAAYCWGKNDSGQMGNGSNAWGPNPLPIAVDASVMTGPVSGIDVGSSHACAVSADKGYCWGSGGYGSLGQGTKSDSMTPVPVDVAGVLSGKKLTGISLGGDTSFATYS